MRILVAEDEESILQFYKILLESEGHEVVLTKDGRECLDSYRAARAIDKPFHLVILDYRMPVKDGMVVAKEISAMYPTQKLLMATAFSGVLDAKDKPENMKIIPKPFEPDQLLDTINVLMPSQAFTA